MNVRSGGSGVMIRHGGSVWGFGVRVRPTGFGVRVLGGSV